MIQDIVQLVKNIAPVSTETTPSRFSNRPPVGGQVAMETFYQETLPHGPSQNSADAVYNHGQQFRYTPHPLEELIFVLYDYGSVLYMYLQTTPSSIREHISKLLFWLHWRCFFCMHKQYPHSLPLA